MIDRLDGDYRRRRWLASWLARLGRWLDARAERRFLRNLESQLERLAPCDRARLAISEVERAESRGSFSRTARHDLVAVLTQRDPHQQRQEAHDGR